MTQPNYTVETELQTDADGYTIVVLKTMVDGRPFYIREDDYNDCISLGLDPIAWVLSDCAVFKAGRGNA